MKLKSLIYFWVALVATSCLGKMEPVAPVAPASAYKVGFSVEGALTKTSAGPDGLSTEWKAGDSISLWARGDNGFEFENFPFTTYGIMGSAAFFSAELQSLMPEGEYDYFACYPAPVSAQGTKAVFSIPEIQDGSAGAGSDIMVGRPVRTNELRPLDSEALGHDHLGIEMDHLLHRLRFYTDGTGLGGEDIRKLELIFPSPVAGELAVDLEGEEQPVLQDGVNVITVQPESPLQPSDAGQRNYAVASIAPVSFGTADEMTVRIFTESKLAVTVIPLNGRTFAAGHSTPVKLIPQSVGDFCRVYVNVASNNLGEPVQSITLSAPAGAKWADNGSETLVYNPGTDIDAGYSFALEYENVEAFRSLSGQNVTVTYDSEHVRISENISIGNLDGKFSTTLSLNVPYLLYEDFSGVSSFSSGDAYGTSNAGSKAAYSFLDGWTGGRVGAEEGHAIRIACRRETSSDYPARVESAPLNGTIKKTCNLLVEFDYGANNRFGGLAIITNGDVGQTCHIGYVTDAEGRASGDTSGNYESENSFYVKEYTGSYTSTPNNADYVIHSAPAESIIRISWRTDIEHQAGTTNTTAWLYLDNIKVRISSK